MSDPKKKNDLRGIVSALLTPFRPDGGIHESALRAIIAQTLSLGVNGFYVCGSTGEGLHLSSDERRQVAEIARDATKDRAFIMVNISHLDRREVVALAKHAEGIGADAVSSLPPLYYPYSIEEIEESLCSLMNETPLPFSIYNVPANTQVKFEEKSFGKFVALKNFIGIKHTSEDCEALNRFKRVCGPDRFVWSARDAHYLPALAMGADGAIGSSFVFLGDLFLAITDAYCTGNVQKARQLQEATNVLHRRLARYGSYQSYKRCLELTGIEAGQCRPPFRPLGKEADKWLTDTLSLLGQTRSQTLKKS